MIKDMNSPQTGQLIGNALVHINKKSKEELVESVPNWINVEPLFPGHASP
jgi:hypothetical protein